MPTPMHLFMGFIAMGMIFFFVGCIVASKPASGTTEWIDYKCRRKFTFCPPLTSPTKFDLLPIFILTFIASGIMLLNAAFVPQSNADISHIAALLNIPLIPFGTGHIYLSHLVFVITVLFLYIFLKNITDGYLIPISGVILLLLDNSSFLNSHKFTTISTTLFILLAFYFAYRYVSFSKRHYHFLFIGICTGIATVLNPSAIISIVGIIAIFLIKELLYYQNRKNKQQTVINIVLFVILCIALPLIVYLAINLLFGYTNILDTLLLSLQSLVSHFSIIKLSSLSNLSEVSLMILAGGIFAIPCCIYQALIAKNGNTLFVIIPFIVYIIQILFTNFAGILPIFAIPVIACGFSALHNRKLNGWIIAYLITAVIYTASLYIFSVLPFTR